MKLSDLLRKAQRVKQKLEHPYTTAVIVAAGSAARMGGIDKIFAPIAKLPVICRTLAAFNNHPLIDEIVVVTRSDVLERMSRVSVSLLRIAVYELLYMEDIPTEVTINEAVELSKKYDGDDSYTFVNGVLGAVAAELVPGEKSE